MFNNNEQLLVEAVKSFLDDHASLGLKPDDKADNDNNPKMRGFEYLHGQIDELFAHKAAELTHYTGICAAFTKIHNYKYLDDSSFCEAMNKEMTAQGIPADERKKALDFIPKIIKELQEEKSAWSEQDFGFNQNLDEIIDVSQPKQYE